MPPQNRRQSIRLACCWRPPRTSWPVTGSCASAILSAPASLGPNCGAERWECFGYGRIGSRVAEICSLGLKMPVLVYVPIIGTRQALVGDVTFTEDLDTVFAQADVVTLHTPLTAATHHLVKERHLRLMKRGSFLINTSRGAVIDESALIRVLQDGHLAGAALDVFDPDPPSPDNPLLHMPNVVATPHIAPFTDAGFQSMWSGVARQIGQLLRAERPANLVNPEIWPGRVASGFQS